MKCTSDRNLKPERGCYIPNLVWINILPPFYNFHGRNLRWRERTLMIPEEWKEEQLRARPCSPAWSLVTPIPQFTRKWAPQSVLTSDPLCLGREKKSRKACGNHLLVRFPMWGEGLRALLPLYSSTFLFSLNPLALTVKMMVIYGGSHLLWEKIHRILVSSTISFVIPSPRHLLFFYLPSQYHSCTATQKFINFFYFISQIMLIYNCSIWFNE